EHQRVSRDHQEGHHEADLIMEAIAPLMTRLDRDSLCPYTGEDERGNFEHPDQQSLKEYFDEKASQRSPCWYFYENSYHRKKGLVKKFICKACLRTAHLPKLLKHKCTKKKLKDKRRLTLLYKLRRMIASTTSEPAKANLQVIAPFEGMAILSGWPCRPIRLQCYKDPEIALRVQAIQVHKERSRPFVLVNLHLQSGDKRIATLRDLQVYNSQNEVPRDGKLGIFAGSKSDGSGSAKATARKRDTREAMRALKNIKLPGQFAFLSPLIPMLVDLLALHPSKLTVKPKKKKKTKAKPIPHAKPDAVQKDATAEVRPPCWYHQKGCCKFGDSCWYSHSHVPPQQSQPAKAREEVESKTSPSKSSAFLPWDLRKDDWNGEIHSLASFSNRLDQLSTTSNLHAVVKVDSDKELDTIKELLAQSDYDQADLQVVAAQPCQNPVMAAANGHDIVFAPVRSRGTLKPRALILHQMTNTCSVTLVSQKIRQASATPEAPKTVVLRIAAEERFCSPAEWKIRKNAPAQMAQKWAQRQVGLNKCKRIHDAWGFTERFYKSSVVMGLMRVDKDLALDLTAKSGIEGWFCEPLNWQDADVPNPAIRWMSKADDESEINYLQRVVAEKAAFGITRGEKQLGARTKRDTSVAHARTWTVQGAPDSWTQETLENILQKELPMQNVTCISRRKERKGRCSWTIRATTLPDQDYFDLQFKDFHLIAFVITTRARPNFSARTLPQRRTMQFSDGQGDLDMQSSPPADPVAPTQLESSQEEQSGEKQDQDMKEPAQKHAASPHKEQQPPKRSRASELTVHQNPPAHMNLITNTGGGDCLFLTCAQGINEVTKREKPDLRAAAYTGGRGNQKDFERASLWVTSGEVKQYERERSAAQKGKAAGPDGWHGSDFAKLSPASTDTLRKAVQTSQQLDRVFDQIPGKVWDDESTDLLPIRNVIGTKTASAQARITERIEAITVQMGGEDRILLNLRLLHSCGMMDQFIARGDLAKAMLTTKQVWSQFITGRLAAAQPVLAGCTSKLYGHMDFAGSGGNAWQAHRLNAMLPNMSEERRAALVYIIANFNATKLAQKGEEGVLPLGRA
ncbi:unnamed protein product, partial [Cladocopium goreaui]